MKKQFILFMLAVSTVSSATAFALPRVLILTDSSHRSPDSKAFHDSFTQLNSVSGKQNFFTFLEGKRNDCKEFREYSLETLSEDSTISNLATAINLMADIVAFDVYHNTGNTDHAARFLGGGIADLYSHPVSREGIRRKKYVDFLPTIIQLRKRFSIDSELHKKFELRNRCLNKSVICTDNIHVTFNRIDETLRLRIDPWSANKQSASISPREDFLLDASQQFTTAMLLMMKKTPDVAYISLLGLMEYGILELLNDFEQSLTENRLQDLDSIENKILQKVKDQDFLKNFYTIYFSAEQDKASWFSFSTQPNEVERSLFHAHKIHRVMKDENTPAVIFVGENHADLIRAELMDIGYVVDVINIVELKSSCSSSADLNKFLVSYFESSKKE